MDTPTTIDLEQIARDLGLPWEKVARTAELLDQGNTVPFITRYRKDQTGGLDEEQIRGIQDKVGKLRMLADRKQTILRSIESQGKLTPELAGQIKAAHSIKRLEDLYLPFKPKKQTRATVARQRGLEPLAQEVLRADPIAADLDKRAADFVDPDKGLHNSAEVLLGVGHLLAEHFGERADVRGRLRKIFRRTGRLVATGIKTTDEQETADADSPQTAPPRETSDIAVTDQSGSAPAEMPEETPVETTTEAPQETAPETSEETTPETPEEVTPPPPEVLKPAPAAARSITQAQKDADAKAEARRRKRKQKENAFKDYFDFQEPISQVPPHRILAVNRGKRARVLRVKIQADAEQMRDEAEKLLVPENHPHAEFLRECVRDVLTRMIFPSLEREARRELTERAEAHAVDVFARNLRKLLLQPPVRNRRVMAIDPGFRSGCKLAALDEYGNVLGHGVIYLIGNEERRRRSRARLVEMIKLYHLSVVAIGNGTACRETELLVAEVIADELKDLDISYVIVNEAGASVYSTSPLAREELPNYDATLRSAVSIGRRLQDPLSELVKITPASIGVGLYQHDVKAKHLQTSLDAVVESSVNFVGVDLNTASPALLRYVSGLNQLTAQRLYDYRRRHGPFTNRRQLGEVPGIGAATFVQAAGFLKITGGDNPLDATWIHPESYETAEAVLEKLGSDVSELAAAVAPPRQAPAVEAASQPPPAAEARLCLKNDPEVLYDGPPRPSSSTKPGFPTASEGHRTDFQTKPRPDASPAAVETFSDDPAQSLDTTGPQKLAEHVAKIDAAALAEQLGVGRLLLEDVLAALVRPGRDPREDLPPPMFRREIMKLEDLQPGTELTGTILNVVDFGAFVDIGLHDSGLIHISRLADKYVRDPHQVVSVGDIVKVWVVGIDKKRRRVSLTAVKPGTEKPRPRGPRKKETTAAPDEEKKKEAKPATQRRRQKIRKATRQDARSARVGRPKQPTGRPRSKPKPVVPITKAMEEGREPMRSFSDLKQLFDKKKTEEEKEEKDGL